MLVLSGDTPLLTAELLARARRDAPRRATPRRPSSRSSPTDPRRTAGSSADADGALQRDRRGSRRDGRAARDREVNSSIYVFAAATLWPALERLEPHERAGRALPHRRGRATSSSDGQPVAVHVAPDADEARGREHPRRARRGGRRPARPHQRRAHARRRHDRRSRDDVDRAGGRARAGRDDPPVHRPARRDAGRRAAPRSARTPSRSTPRSAPVRSSDRSVTFAPARCSRRARRRARSWRSRTREIGRTDEGAAPLLHRRRRDRRGHEHRRREHHRRTSRTSPAGRRSARRSAATSGPASTMRSSLPSRSATTPGLRRARSITEDVPPARSPSPGRDRTTRRATPAWRRRPTTTELDAAGPRDRPRDARQRDRAGALDRARRRRSA